MYNKVILLGRLTQEVEIKYIHTGLAIANTGIAVTRKWKDKQGERKEDTLFIDITFFGGQAEAANRYLKKGSKILIDGRLKFQQWVAQDGTKKYRHLVEVEQMQMLDCKDNSYDNKNYKEDASEKQKIPDIDVDDGEIPF